MTIILCFKFPGNFRPLFIRMGTRSRREAAGALHFCRLQANSGHNHVSLANSAACEG
jgi:hypothetical protein